MLIVDGPHEKRTTRVASQLRARTRGRPVRILKRSPPHQVPKCGDLRRSDDVIDVRDLDNILLIDREQRVCVAEPGVTFDALVAETLRVGLVPFCVPELKGITIGGAVAGGSLESMSFRHGGFHDNCLAYEVIAANGNVVTCGRDAEDADDRLLFQMLHGTFGTLGILSNIAFRLVPAAKYVKLTYERYSSFGEFRKAIRRHADAADIDFMDGIIHSGDNCALVLGELVDAAPYTHSYRWIRQFAATTSSRRGDFMRTADYFFRYDRGVTNARPFVGSSLALGLADRFHFLLRQNQIPFTLDTFTPMSRTDELMDWYQRTVGHFPLWCVPYKRVHDYEWLTDFIWRSADDLWLDIAIYGMKWRDGLHQLFEEKLYELGAIKTLISSNYYSRERFWEIWNPVTYCQVKRRMDPENVFRDLYEKTCQAAMGIPP